MSYNTNDSLKKYSINLYRDELRPRRDLLSLSLLVGLVAALVVAALLTSAVLVWQESRLRDTQQITAAQLEQARLNRDQLTAALRDRRVDAELERRLAGLEADNSGLQRLADAVRLPVQDNARQYSGLLRDLSAVHQHGLWLSVIENQNGRLRLEGQTSHAGHLPAWMARFEQVEALRGRQFAVVALEEGDDAYFHFVLRSQRDSQRTSQEAGTQRREGVR